ncbi:phosphoglycerate mutase, partial [Xanthomonas oryzae pv. oryzae]
MRRPASASTKSSASPTWTDRHHCAMTTATLLLPEKRRLPGT